MNFNFFRRKKSNSPNKPSHLSLEEQLDVLRRCGISPLPEITIEHFLLSWDRQNYESDAYKLALVKLGGEIEEPPWGRWMSNNVWHFDTECIEGPGSYVRIAERMKDLSQGDLPITDITDHLDEMRDEDEQRWQGIARLEFSLDETRSRWDLRIDNDWVDASVMSRFAQLLVERGTGRRYTYLDLGGQDCLIGCATPQQLEMLRNETGLDFNWLK